MSKEKAIALLREARLHRAHAEKLEQVAHRHDIEHPEHNSFRPEKAREALERALGEIHPRLSVEALRSRKEERRHDIDEDIERREHEVKASAGLTAEQHYKAAGYHRAIADHHAHALDRHLNAGRGAAAAKHFTAGDVHVKKAEAHVKAGEAIDGGAGKEAFRKAHEHGTSSFGKLGSRAFKHQHVAKLAESALGGNHHEAKASAAPSASQHYRASGIHGALTDHHGIRALAAKKAGHEDKARAHNKLSDFHQKKADAHFAAGVKKDGGEKSHHSDAAYNSAHKTFGTPGTKHFDVKKANSHAKAALTSNPHEVKASVGEMSPVSKLSKDKQAAAHCKLGALHGHLRDHALKNKNFASAVKHSDKSINHHDVAHKININAPKKHERIARAAEANVVKHFGKGTDEHFRSHEATKEADRLHKGLYGRR